MRLLIDMNLTPRWVESLNAAGFEAVHWSAIGAITASDAEISEFARTHNFVVVTNDMDFPRILAFTAQGKPSVVLLRGQPLTPESRAVSLAQAIRDCRTELEGGAILAVDWDGRPRARLLPLR